MSSALLTAQPLVFSKSASKSVGMNGNFMDMMRSNSARIVGSIKFVGDAAQGFTGHPLMIACAAISMFGRVIMVAFGTKENQKKQIEKEKLEQGQKEPVNVVSKVLQPHKYPIESSTGLSIVAEFLTIGYGVSRFMGGATGFSSLIVGAGSLLSYAYILLAKEKNPEEKSLPDKKDNPDLVFSKSTSENVGWFGALRDKMKGNPVLVSSLVSFAISSVNFFGGMIEGIPALTVTGAIFMCAYAFQAAFVRKNDFNIEGAREQNIPSSHTEKLVRQQRDADKGTGYSNAPA